LPDKKSCKKLKTLYDSLEPFENLTKKLQKDNMTLKDVRGYFDGVLIKYPQLETKLGNRAKFINNPFFEDGIVKIQNGLESD